MPGSVNGHPVQFIFDTGAGAPFILYRATAEQVGIKIVAPPNGPKPDPGTLVPDITEPAKLELLGQSFSDVQFGILDVSPFLNDVQGIVGWPALRENILMLKVAEQSLRLDLANVPAETKSWLKLRLRAQPADHDVLVVELPAKPGTGSKAVLIDTGDPGGVSLSSDKWREWKAANPREPFTLTAGYTPGAGIVVSEESWADELSLDGLILHGVTVTESNVAQTNSAPEFAASLGLAALARLDLVIDGKAGLAYLNPRTEPVSPHSYNKLGAVFVPRNEQSDELVAHVAAGSPAAVAGVRDGDLLLKIDQLDLTKWRTQPDLLPFTQYVDRDAGTKLVLTLKRGQATIIATATLKEILGPKAPSPDTRP